MKIRVLVVDDSPLIRAILREAFERTSDIEVVAEAADGRRAIDEVLRGGDPADVRGISQYIKGGKIPVCPQGGTYTINPIGTLPVCSIPGHQME